MEFVTAAELVRRAVNTSMEDECFGNVTEAGMFYAVLLDERDLCDLINFLETGEAINEEEAKVLARSCGAIYSINDQGIWDVRFYEWSARQYLERDIEELRKWEEQVCVSVEDGE